MKEIDFYLEKLVEYYSVSSQEQLAIKIGVTPQTISTWKARNSISAIKKRCRELGIYKDIFGDSSIAISQGTGSRASAKNYFENINSPKNIEFEDLTMSLIKSLIEKFGEEELQYKLMELKRNA